MLVAVNGECTSPACMDEELGKVCSGHGTCNIQNPATITCNCEASYTYVAPGRCILTTLMEGINVCSDHGRIVFDPPDSSTMKCNCSSIYTGDKCETCNTNTAEEINKVCTAKKCIIQTPQPTTRAADDSRVCGPDGQYTTFGDPSNPFITCIPKDSDSGNVSAYNGTFSAKPGCVHVSKIDKTRRFFCGFLHGITEDLPTNNSVTCGETQEDSPHVVTCTACPTNFNLVHFGPQGGNTKTCMHKSCHDGSQYHMWYNYCGGVGDCVQNKEKNGYECGCGAGATWNDTLKACVTDACKLNKTLAGPSAPEYCTPQSGLLQCTVGRDATWQCNCEGGTYLTYNKTCISKSKNADPKTHRARGLCGGPGAGYIDDTGACVCNDGFFKIGDMCYSYDCLPVGIPTDIKKPDINMLVCSGKGVCTYNQLTGRYGCECEGDLEAFGGYCTYPTCAGKVLHNGEVKYVECQVYNGYLGTCSKNSGEANYSCKCRYPLKLVNNVCVYPGCVSTDNIYCGGDVLALCVEESDRYHGCVCSEGYERGQNRWECIPRKCVYRRSLSDPAVACNGLGTCSSAGLLKDRACSCTGDAKEYTLQDASGEIRKTCILDACISSKEKEIPVICGGFGRCGPDGCICDLGTKLVDKICVGIDCFINITDTTGKVTTSVCGGEGIGACKKIGSQGNRLDYACKCNESNAAGYKEVDGFCLPEQCIFKVPKLNEEAEVDTMCGGRHFGSCVINTTDPTKSYCECKRGRYDVTKMDDGKCMKTLCRSAVLPGGPTGNIECSGHGRCATNDKINYLCKCEPNYGIFGEYLCIPNICIVSSADTTKICSGAGTCSLEADSGGCKCYTGYTGDQCKECDSKYKRHISGACYLNNCPADDDCGTIDNSSAGTCQLVNTAFICVCSNPNLVVDKTNKQCRMSKCIHTDPYEKIEKACYNMGTCDYSGNTETCSCNSGTTRIGTSVCVYVECMPNGSTDDPDMICNKRGRCVEGPVAGKGICRCDSSTYRTDKKTGQCFVKECFGAHESILSEVCDGGGTCSEDTKRCNCNVDGFQSLDGQNGCMHSSCISSDNKLCSGFGACEKTGDTYSCLCANYYTLVKTDCIPTRCLNQTVVCNNGGTCSGEGSSAVCSCKSGWAIHGTLCYPSACVSDGALCGGNGDCQLSDGGSCTCRSGYETVSGKLCISSQCVQRGTDGTVTICGGNGRCVSENGVQPTCVCDEGFSLTGDFVCGVSASSNKSSSVMTIAVVAVVLLVLAAMAGFLVWWFVIRPKRAGVLRERTPLKDPSLSGPQKLKRQAGSNASLHATAPLLSRSSRAGSSA
ncbi:EGF-like high cysteine membrane protein [Giardia lamblia P15]|uniref:EGF-like high cysteine membrane protein n=1 Tax=Giardia intestinalis (strain P15) TaxID=658858 RepID=E1F855_GIAIA|nr:EGF-like high cysteine membrane protein [Giardia lamblia P15]